jgi:signal transduction histidine kinase
MTLSISALISFGALAFYSVLLVIVVRRDFRNSENRFFGLYLLSMIIWSFGSFMIFAQLDVLDTLFWNRFMIIGSAAMPVAFFGFVQVFLRQGQGRWLQIGLVLYLVTLIANAMGWVVKQAYVSEGRLYNEYGPLFVLPSATWALFIAFSAYLLIREYSETKDAFYRNRVRYLLIVIIVIFAGSLTNATVLQIYPVDIAFNVLSALIIAYAILRYQLLDISVVVRKGLLYSIPTAIIGAGYFLLIYFSTRLFHAFGGPEIFILSLAVAITTAVIARPLHVKAQSWIDRLFFREKYDSGLMLQRLSHTATFVLDLDSLTTVILSDVCSTMHIEAAAVFLKREKRGDFVLTAQKGLDARDDLKLRKDHPIVDWLSRQDGILTRHDVDVMPRFKALWGQEREDLERVRAELFIALKTQGELVGIFAVGPKRSEEIYSLDDQLTLTTLANQTATAIEKARLYQAAQQELNQRKRAEEEIRRRAAHLEALNATIAAAAAATNLQELLETALDHTLRALRLEMGAIWLSRDWWSEGPREHGAHVAASRGSVSLLVLSGLSSTAAPFLDRLTLSIDPDVPKPSAVEDLGHTDVGNLAAAHGIHASLTAPILVEAQPVGGLSLFSSEPRGWTAEETALTETVGRQLGTAAERLRLFQEVRRHADELAVALAEAKELDRLKSEFVQSVNHELRTPLALARGYAELLREGEMGPLQPEQKSAIDIIVRRVRMLSELVEDITLILGAEARPLAREPVALDELTRAAVDDFRVAADQAGLTVNSEIAPDVAPALGESVYLRRVLDNLLTNAIKFTPKGNTITARVWQEDRWVILQVSDTGIGIPDEEQRRIFDRFYQVDGSTSRRYSGVGLGLALVKEVVETLGGEVGVTSELDKGSTFTVRLPAADGIQSPFSTS